MRGATCSSASMYCIIEFLSTLPVRGATQRAARRSQNQTISIHAPREGSDLQQRDAEQTVRLISIHAPREGSDWCRLHKYTTLFPISIHAPREGSDATLRYLAEQQGFISIHAPREGSDCDRFSGPCIPLRFLSTLPVRGATGKNP